jgi:hypothetical protein
MRARCGRPGWALGALVLAAAAPAWPAEYSIGGRVSAQVGYNDNVDLSVDDEQGSGSGILAGEANFRVRTPATELGIDAAADVLRYTDASDQDTDNQRLRAFAQRSTPRSTYGLEASYRRDSESVDQFDASGNELDTNRRETFRLAPSFSHRLTPRDSLVASASYQRRDNSAEDQVDSDLWGGTLGLRRLATRRTTLGGQVNVSYFESDDQESWQVGPQAFVGYRLEDRIDLTLSVGPSWIRTDETVQSPLGQRSETTDEFGLTVDGRVDWRATATTDVSVALLRGLDQGGAGGEATERTRLSASVDHRLTRRLRLSVDGAAQRRSDLGDDGGDTDDFELGPRLRYALTERTELSIGYRWRYRDTESDGDAMSNAVFFRVAYAIPIVRASW